MLYIIACRKSVYIFSMRVDSYKALLFLTWCRCAQLFIKYIYGWNKVKEWNMTNVCISIVPARAAANQELKLPSSSIFEAWNTSRYWFWRIPVPQKAILLLVQKQNVSLLQARCTQDGETTVACRRLGELFAGNKIWTSYALYALSFSIRRKVLFFSLKNDEA